MADDDIASRQQLLDHAQAERETEIQPYSVADDLRGEAIAGITGRGNGVIPSDYPPWPAPASQRAAKLTVPSVCASFIAVTKPPIRVGEGTPGVIVPPDY